jgi:hypothetical protein
MKQKEACMAQFGVLSRYLFGVSIENHEKAEKFGPKIYHKRTQTLCMKQPSQVNILKCA